MSPPDSKVIPHLDAGLPPESAAGLPREFLGTDLGEVLQAYRRYLLGVAWQMLPNGLLGKVAPSDVVQETLLRGYREFPEFTGNDLPELVAWLRQILVNQVADHVRRFDSDKRRVSLEVRLVDDLVDAQAVSPSQPLLSAEEWHRLESGLNRLSTLHREVILLRHREGYTFNQIGDLLGKSPDAVRKLWERALQNLQHLLGTSR
jgi:RNA polymerase sigma-70 factor (ECF subfamily)